MLQEAVKTSNESNGNPILNYQVQGDLLLKWREETLERTKFDRDTLNQEARTQTRIHKTLRVDS